MALTPPAAVAGAHTAESRGTTARRLIVPAVASAIGVAVLVSLGVWQLQRMQWKEALMARVESGIDAIPIPAPGPNAWMNGLEAFEYRSVTVRGHFLNDREIFVNSTLTEPRGAFGGYGFLVVAPFVTEDGWAVYVNRGFVPRNRKSPETRRDGWIEGPTEVVGLLRLPLRRAWFMPADDADGNEWFSRDPILFAEAQGYPLSNVAPYMIDARLQPDLPGGLPQGGETIVAFSNNHFGYALTWFGLAAVLVAVFVAFARARIRDSRME